MKVHTIIFCVIVGIIGFSEMGQSKELFFDDFSTDLSSWNASSHGSWRVKNDELYGNYDVDCNATSCRRADLLLNDKYQPSGDYRSSIDFRRTVDSGSSDLYTSLANFVLWKDDNNAMSISIGAPELDSGGRQQSEISVSVSIWNGSWLKDAGEIVVNETYTYDWNPDDWHTASLEKKGHIYSLYIDDVFLSTLEDTFLYGEGKIGLHNSRIITMDNFILSEIERRCPRSR